MIIKTQLSEKDFINASLNLGFNKLYYKIVLVIFLLMSCILITNSILLRSVDISVFIPTIIICYVYISTYFRIKKAYKKDKRIAEVIEYEFTQDLLLMKGESFSSQLTWDRIFKVTHSKKWIFIWQSGYFANIIPKRDLWESQIDDLKTILNNHKIKNNL